MHSFLSANPVKIISAILLGAMASEGSNLIMAFIKYQAFGTQSGITLIAAATIWAFIGAVTGSFVANWMLGKRNIFVLAIIGLVSLRPALGTPNENNLMLFSILAVLLGFTLSELLARTVKPKFNAS